MESNIDKAVQNLKEGKIGIFPTDTAYGIGCRADNETSVKRVYSIRNRPEEKALLILVSSIEMASQYADIGDDVKEKLIDRYWPGGLTIILYCKTEKIPQAVRAGGPTIAIRLPNNPTIREVIEKVGVPIVAPSANFSGDQTPFSLEEVDRALLKEVDFVLPGVCTMKGISTIIDTTVSPWKVVREGVIKLDETANN
jgi:L-threonylcarbamoyladenylate synthase